MDQMTKEEEQALYEAELEALMAMYPEDYPYEDPEDEGTSMLDLIKQAAKLGGAIGLLGLEKVGIDTGPIVQEYKEDFAMGGLAEARKGITTQEGKEMAKKKFQLDQKEADLDGDGQLSEYEEARGEAIQKAMADDPEQDEKYGMNCGGMMEPMGYDEVSGNPIPIGSTPENVRDDIEIRISEGEYVLPADVVKWHGLKHIMDMQDEAKMGLMGMAMEGLIQYVDEDPEATTECPNCMGKGCEYCEGEAGEEVEDAEIVSEDDTDVPSEEVDVEYPAVEVEDELAEAGTEEEYPEEAPLPGMMKKQKYAFIIS